jgi:hypothetical protein
MSGPIPVKTPGGHVYQLALAEMARLLAGNPKKPISTHAKHNVISVRRMSTLLMMLLLVAR